MSEILSAVYLSTGWSPFGWWFAALLASMVDAVTTAYLIRIGGRELNPALAWLMSALGALPALVVTKMLGMAAVLYYLQPLVLYLPLIVGLYIGLNVWNCYWIWWQRQAVAARLRSIGATD